MRIQNIQMSNNTPVNFKASVSEQVKYQLYSQLSKGPDKKKTTKLLASYCNHMSYTSRFATNVYPYISIFG